MSFVKKNYIICFIFFLFLSNQSIFSESNKWQIIKTKYFTIFYPHQYEKYAYNVLNELEYSRERIEKFTNNKLYSVPIVIEDIGSMSNGYADSTYFNIHLFTYNPGDSINNFLENWPRLVSIHEYTHMMTITQVSDTPKIFCDIFGNIFLPNQTSPLWLLEGFAVYEESQSSIFEGRLNDGFFNYYLRTRAKNKFPSIIEATCSPLNFPYLNGPYLYGSLFIQYLKTKYGEQNLTNFLYINGSNTSSLLSPIFPYIGIDSSAKTIFNKTFPQLWNEWKNYELSKTSYTCSSNQITNTGW